MQEVDRTVSPVAREAPQVVDRVARILMGVSRSGSVGARLKDLALETGISRPTVHRLLQELTAVDFVRQQPDRRYVLGPALFALGQTAPNPIHDLDAVRDVARRLADRCGELVYVALRRLDGVQYILRVDGSHALPKHLIAVGDTKPFTAGYAGLALLASMTEEEQRTRIHRIEVDAPPEWVASRHWHLQRAFRDKLDEVLTLGYCTGCGVMMPGVGGIAAPVPSRQRTPYMAVSISATEQRLGSDRVKQLVPQLMSAVRQISEFIE